MNTSKLLILLPALFCFASCNSGNTCGNIGAENPLENRPVDKPAKDTGKFHGLTFFVWGNFQDRSNYYLNETAGNYIAQIQRHGGSINTNLDLTIDFVVIGYRFDELQWTDTGMSLSTLSDIYIESYEDDYSEVISWALENEVVIIDEDTLQEWISGSAKLARMSAEERRAKRKNEVNPVPSKNSADVE